MKITHIVTTSLLCFSTLLFAQSSKDDNQVVASSLYTKALKIETEDYNYAKAIEIYKDILSKAPDQSEFIAKALYRTGLCYEKMEPENINDAQSSYARIVSDYTNQTELVKKTEEKKDTLRSEIRSIQSLLQNMTQEKEKLDKDHVALEKKEEAQRSVLQESKQTLQ